MLSGESAKGLYPVEAVETMSKICMQAEKDIDHAALFTAILDTVQAPVSIPESVASSAVKVGRFFFSASDLLILQHVYPPSYLVRSRVIFSLTHVCTHRHIHRHTYTHTNTHTHITHTHTFIYIHTHTHTHKFIYVHTHTHTHTYTHTHTHTHTHTLSLSTHCCISHYSLLFTHSGILLYVCFLWGMRSSSSLLLWFSLRGTSVRS
jgi:hypothetical protein